MKHRLLPVYPPVREFQEKADEIGGFMAQFFQYRGIDFPVRITDRRFKVIGPEIGFPPIIKLSKKLSEQQLGFIRDSIKEKTRIKEIVPS